MNQMNPLERIWVWCKRFRHRCGYGVHSPFAFNLITWVIYEKDNFYAYADLENVRFALHREGYRELGASKVNKLLFRLVNYLQPQSVLELGTGTGLQMYAMAAAKKEMRCVTVDLKSDLNPVAESLLGKCQRNIEFETGDVNFILSQLQDDFLQFDFVHFNQYVVCETAMELCIRKAAANSLFVIEGIHSSEPMRSWWERIIEDERTGITFDLYYAGLVFFDKTKIKQHYIVNF